MLENLGFHPKYLETWKLLWKKRKKGVKFRLGNAALTPCGYYFPQVPSWAHSQLTDNSYCALLLTCMCFFSWRKDVMAHRGGPPWVTSWKLEKNEAAKLIFLWGTTVEFLKWIFAGFGGFQLFKEKLKNLAESTDCGKKKVVNTQSSIEKNVGQDFFFLTSFNKRAINTFLEHCK